MKSNSIDSAQLLAQMRTMARAAGVEAATQTENPMAVANAKGDNNFSNLLVRAINNVNETQMESSRLANEITTGDGGASLVRAMIASQKSSIAFQAAVQVRNKVASAYQDIMNMPI